MSSSKKAPNLTEASRRNSADTRIQIQPSQPSFKSRRRASDNSTPNPSSSPITKKNSKRSIKSNRSIRSFRSNQSVRTSPTPSVTSTESSESTREGIVDNRSALDKFLSCTCCTKDRSRGFSPAYTILDASATESETDDDIKYGLDELTVEEEEFFELVSSGNVTDVVKLIENEDKQFTINGNLTNLEGNTVLHIAVARQDENMVNVLCNKLPGFKAAVFYDTLLHAVKEKNLGIVRTIDKKARRKEFITNCLNKQLRRKNKSKAREQGKIKLVCDTVGETNFTLLQFHTLSNFMAFTGILNPYPNSKYHDDITPLLLAAQIGSYELIEYFMLQGDGFTDPHARRCCCLDCSSTSELQRCYRRLHIYRAICNPYYICYKAAHDDKHDPILKSFELTQELNKVKEQEHEFKMEYKILIDQLKIFTCDLIEQCRSSTEVQLVLKQRKGYFDTTVERYPRLALALQLRQKEFVAHPHTQMVLYHQWAGEYWPGWKSMHWIWVIVHVMLRIPGFVLISVLMILNFECTKLGKCLNAPVNRCLTYVGSYIVFLAFLVYLSIAEREPGDRGPPSAYGIEYLVMVWVVGYFVSLVNQAFYARRLFWISFWSWYDFINQVLFLCTFVCWIAAWKVKRDLPALEREFWGPYEPILIAELFFAIASILTYVKALRILQLHRELGPLITAVGRMGSDVSHIFLFFFIAIVSNALGMTLIYQTYRKWEDVDEQGETTEQSQAFISVYNSVANLFWVIFAMSSWDSADMIEITVKDPDNPHLVSKHHLAFTQWAGKTIYAVYHVIASLILLNMLLATMSNTYERITQSETAVTEWRFVRSRIWTWFARDTVNPPPFNLIPRFGFCIQTCCSRESQDEIAVRHHRERFDYYNLVSKLIYRYFREKADTSSVQPASGSDLVALKEDLDELRETIKPDAFKIHANFPVTDWDSPPHSPPGPSTPNPNGSIFETSDEDGNGSGKRQAPLTPAGPGTPPLPVATTSSLPHMGSSRNQNFGTPPKSPGSSLPHIGSSPARNQNSGLPPIRPSPARKEKPTIPNPMKPTSSTGFRPTPLEAKSSAESIRLPQFKRPSPSPPIPPPLPPLPSNYELTLMDQAMQSQRASASSSKASIGMARSNSEPAPQSQQADVKNATASRRVSFEENV